MRNPDFRIHFIFKIFISQSYDIQVLVILNFLKSNCFLSGCLLVVYLGGLECLITLPDYLWQFGHREIEETLKNVFFIENQCVF